MAELILASASPRRVQLLRQAGKSFEIEPSKVDETLDPRWTARQAAEALAERKAQEIAARHRGTASLVVGADTLVVLGEGPQEQLLGKPSDAVEARTMLETLSATRHRVITGVCVVRCLDGALRTAHEQTWVAMRAITTAEVAAYVDSDEWSGKAGGYAIQENADAFVVGLEGGGFDNVVGLPVALTLGLLEALDPKP